MIGVRKNQACEQEPEDVDHVAEEDGQRGDEQGHPEAEDGQHEDGHGQEPPRRMEGMAHATMMTASGTRLMARLISPCAMEAIAKIVRGR